MLISVKSLELWRGDRCLLTDVNFTVDQGEVVVIIGANGSGKSTLLASLSGDLSVPHGEVRIGGKTLDQWSNLELARFRAVMKQSSRLELPFTVEEVVLMGRSPLYNSRESKYDLTICELALKMTDLDGFAQRLYTQLSGGEQRRVQLARTLAQVWPKALLNQSTSSNDQSKLLLLDEPTANLDIEAQHRFMNCVQQFAKVGGGVLCILHDMNLAAQYATRVIVLGQKRVLVNAPPKKALTPEIIKQAFQVEAHCLVSNEFGFPIIITPPLDNSFEVDYG